MPQIAYFCSSVAAERFGSNQKSRTFAIPFEKRVSEKTMSSYERLAARKENLKIFKKKFGSLKIMLTFASPFEKRASKEEQQVH